MKSLVEGHRSFVKEKLPSIQTGLQKFENGQSPKALFVTCSDSRIDPHLITNSVPGELFVIRNAGNFISPKETSSKESSVVSTLEYAINILGIKNVIICGHSDCGAIKATQQDLETTNFLKDYIPRLKQEGDFQLDNAIEKNVLKQIQNIKEFDFLNLADVNFFGWVYKVSTGRLSVFNEETQSFELVD